MKNILKNLLQSAVMLLTIQFCIAQEIPSEHILETDALVKYLKPEVVATMGGENSVTTEKLAAYFRTQFARRYFYDWQKNNERFSEYQKLYPEAARNHQERAKDHMDKFPAKAEWKLPYTYKNGEAVNAYAMRHLARQHKMVDIAFEYNYQNKNTTYLTYFKDQLHSLNTALEANKYETIADGNGTYEAFRSGYRILNWLEIHNLFLGEKSYTDQDQLATIATLLQHASNLYESNTEFTPGNHQTRGMSALAMLSILFDDFKDAKIWRARAMEILEEHLRKEINSDGFQFERTVHYHISDIDTYFYVYQLAKNSNVPVSTVWENKLKSLFTTLTKIGFPDQTAPVFSDDTDTPWAENNSISGALTLGYLLFDDPEMGYFADTYVTADTYWFLNQRQLDKLKSIEKVAPQTKSTAFPVTGFYFMRQGWENQEMMMAISNCLDPDKPDHQHVYMLGIQAMANGHIILPNYQVRYSLPDYEFFKNSMVKNVALVDNELQGKGYSGNQGGSGFGKFKTLPQPKTIVWKTTPTFDLYIGSHNGFENVNTTYSRQILFLKDELWIVKDNFESKETHTYKQVWQGHYSMEAAPKLLRSSFSDGSGTDIYQLLAVDSVSTSGKNGKEWSVVSKSSKNGNQFITAIVPFAKFDECIDDASKSPKLKNWSLNSSDWKASGNPITTLTKENTSIFFGATKLSLNSFDIEFAQPTDVMITATTSKVIIQSIHTTDVKLNYLIKKKKKSVLLSAGGELAVDLK
jgi:hypothetical protein